MHFKFQERLALFLIIRRKDAEVFHSCEHYFFVNHKCIIMTDHKKCAKCVRRDRSCVRLFLKTLKATRVKVKTKLSKTLDEPLFRLLSKIARLRKTLNHTEKRIDKKTLCLTQELVDDNEDAKNEASFDLSQFLRDLFNDFWRLLAFSSDVETFSEVSDSSQGS